MAHRDDQRGGTDAKVTSNPCAVAAENAARVDADRDVLQPGVAAAVAMLDVLVHLYVHDDDAGSIPTQDRCDDQRVQPSEYPVIPRLWVLQPCVYRKQGRDRPAARVRRRGPTQVEELTVLVDDVGAEVVEQSPQSAAQRRTQRE